MLSEPSWRSIAATIVVLSLSACGGGSSGTAADSSAPTSTSTPTPTQAAVPPAAAPTVADASRLLEQATFGVTASDLANVQSAGISAYLAAQLIAAPSQYTGFTYAPHTAPSSCQDDGTSDASSICARDQYSNFQVQRQFFIHALHDSDQLRQRVAFALSQIFVVSGIEIYEAYGMSNYQNMLLQDAFANYRTILQDVTLSPVMGHYLDMANNARANAAAGTEPNENYGREIMQLMSVGVYALNADGSLQLDASGAPIPTYDQAVVDGFSAALTGWTYPPTAGTTAHWGDTINYEGVMISVAAQHEPAPKLLLDGLTTASNQTPEQDLSTALDDIFNHPNVGPFIGKQLIQHLVTSNPSPAYVARISAVFANNGQGVRGDMGAVVTAILTDPEARGDAPVAADFGHLREPALFVAAAFRSLGGQSDGELLASASAAMGQPIYGPATVFNYYPPSNLLPGTTTLAPEFAIDDAATVLARANFVNTVIMQGGASADPTVTASTGSSINLASLAATTDPAALVAQLNQTLMHGSLSDQASSIIQAAVAAQGMTNPLAEAQTSAYLILSSGQFQVER
jgi:uncharacterized protein (DUF1800 family)